MAKAKKAAKKAVPDAAQPSAINLPKITVLKALLAEAEEEITTVDTVYTVNASSNDITLEVIAGDTGQSCVMTVILDGTTLVHNVSGNFPLKVIGTNGSLNGKKLRIIANVADLSRQTNITSLDINLKGGRKNRAIPLMKKVAAEGDSVQYVCLLEFFNPLL